MKKLLTHVSKPTKALVVLTLALVACRLSPNAPRELNLYPTPTTNATQTPLVVVLTQTPYPTYTPNAPTIVVLTPTNGLGDFCVSALVAVYLRPSPSTDNYPIVEITNGALVVDLGGRNGNWYFVQYGDKQGWVDSAYLTLCQQGKSPFMYVSGDVVSMNTLPNGNIGSVGKVTVCEDTKVWGSPRTDVPVVGELKAGEVILSHEIYQDWMMFEPAEWIPLNVICEFRSD